MPAKQQVFLSYRRTDNRVRPPIGHLAAPLDDLGSPPTKGRCYEQEEVVLKPEQRAAAVKSKVRLDSTHDRCGGTFSLARFADMKPCPWCAPCVAPVPVRAASFDGGSAPVGAESEGSAALLTPSEGDPGAGGGEGGARHYFRFTYVRPRGGSSA